MIRQEMNRIDPDVMGLTEVGVAITPQGHVIEADPDYGYTHDGSRRKVILWSKTPWEEMDAIGDPEMPTGRFVSGVTQGIRFVGVCIPWRDAHVKTGRKAGAHGKITLPIAVVCRRCFIAMPTTPDQFVFWGTSISEFHVSRSPNGYLTHSSSQCHHRFVFSRRGFKTQRERA